MFRAFRAVVLAIIIVASFVATGSVASAHSGDLPKPPHLAQPLDVTWE